MSEINGVLWARLRFYVTMGSLIGVVVAGSFTIFETQSDHDTDINRLLRNQERIIKRLDQLYFKNNTGLTTLPLRLPAPEPERLLDA